MQDPWFSRRILSGGCQPDKSSHCDRSVGDRRALGLMQGMVSSLYFSIK